MKIKILAFIYLCVAMNCSWAALQINIEPTEGTINDTFNLTITQESPSTRSVPDLTPLQKDFIVIGTQRQLNYTVINGQAQSSSQWVITLKPLKEGLLTLPAITLGREHTNPLTININVNESARAKAINAEASKDIFLQTTISPQKPYLNQQIIYTVTLYNNKRLLDAEYQGPKVENALIFPLGEARRYQTIHNNNNYLAEEQTYAIFPQQSGALEILSPQFSALIYDIHPERVTATNAPLKVEVQPIPQSFKNKTWLPAQNIILTENYEYTASQLKEGSTLTRHITIRAKGLPAQLLPALEFKESREFKAYPEKGEEENKVIENNVVGERELKVTYLLHKAGQITLPEVRLPWFNTEKNQAEEALLPSKTLTILPLVTPGQSNVDTTLTTAKVLGQQTKATPFTARKSFNIGWGVALFFAIAWFITLGFLWRHKRKGQYASPTNKILSALKRACMENKAQKARDLLLLWGKSQWPEAQLLNLNDLNTLTHNLALKKQIQLLSEALYSTSKYSSWQGEALLQAIRTFKKSASTKSSEALSPIHPF